MIGEDVIENVKMIKFILQVLFEFFLLEFCGECYMFKEVFVKFNECCEVEGQLVFVNLCNVVVGFLCQLDLKVMVVCQLDIFMYYVFDY